MDLLVFKWTVRFPEEGERHTRTHKHSKHRHLVKARADTEIKAETEAEVEAGLKQRLKLNGLAEKLR